jgi:RHS repeat-associated protein
VRKTIDGAATESRYDGLNVLQEIPGVGPAVNLLTGLGIDEVFSRTDASGRQTVLPDALGSTVALADDTGTVGTQYTYEPFGDVTTAGSNGNPFQYTGRENDGSGLYFYRARYYRPQQHRFLSGDPIDIRPDAVNLYAYVGNNPLGFVDPFGLARKEL